MTTIQASVKRCFDLSLSIDLEQNATAEYGLQAVGGVTTGTIKLGERVTWKARQFGIWVRHTTEITAFDRPAYFQDSMVAGVFRYFVHDHYFVALDAAHTEMRDEMRFAMPLWLGGILGEELLIRRRMLKLLTKRNATIKEQAEAD